MNSPQFLNEGAWALAVLKLEGCYTFLDIFGEPSLGAFPTATADWQSRVCVAKRPAVNWLEPFFSHKIFPFSRSPTCHWCQSISHFGEYPPGTSAKCVFQALAHSLLLTNCYFYIGMLSFFRDQMNTHFMRSLMVILRSPPLAGPPFQR